jgi:hypothetical protein
MILRGILFLIIGKDMQKIEEVQLYSSPVLFTIGILRMRFIFKEVVSFDENRDVL